MLKTVEHGRTLAWYVCSRNVFTFREWSFATPFVREDAETLIRVFTADQLFRDEVFWIEPIREEYKHRDRRR